MNRDYNRNCLTCKYGSLQLSQFYSKVICIKSGKYVTYENSCEQFKKDRLKIAKLIRQNTKTAVREK